MKGKGSSQCLVRITLLCRQLKCPVGEDDKSSSSLHRRWGFRMMFISFISFKILLVSWRWTWPMSAKCKNSVEIFDRLRPSLHPWTLLPTLTSYWCVPIAFRNFFYLGSKASLWAINTKGDLSLHCSFQVVFCGALTYMGNMWSYFFFFFTCFCLLG